jgi:hypothetical protein
VQQVKLCRVPGRVWGWNRSSLRGQLVTGKKGDHEGGLDGSERLHMEGLRGLKPPLRVPKSFFGDEMGEGVAPARPTLLSWRLLAPPRRWPSSNSSFPPRASLLLAQAVAGASFSAGRGQGRGRRVLGLPVQPEITRLPALCTCQWPPGGRQYHLPKCPARPRASKVTTVRVAFLSHGAPGLPAWGAGAASLHSPCQSLIGALRLGRSRTFRDAGPYRKPMPEARYPNHHTKCSLRLGLHARGPSAKGVCP